MWQFNYTIPTVILQVFIIILYFSRKRLPVRVSREFILLIVIDLATITLDYVPSMMDNYWQNYTIPELTIANGLFFLLFIGRSFTFYDFTAVLCDEWHRSSKMHLFTMYLPVTILAILVIASPFTGWIFTITEQGYASGPLYNIINYQFLYTSVMMMVLLYRSKKTYPELRRTIGWLYATCLFVGVLVRMAFPKVILMNMFCMFAIMLIFFGYLNPESFIDSELGLFNSVGWKRVLRENYQRGRGKRSLVGFVIRDFNEVREIYGEAQLDEGLHMIGEYLLQRCAGMNVFHLGLGHFIIQSERAEFDEDKLIDDLKERFTRHWTNTKADLVLSIGTIRLGKDTVFPDAETTNGCVRYAFELVNKPVDNGTAIIYDTILKEYEREVYVKKCLNLAVENKEVLMYLQPINDAKDGTLVGCEALARIKDPDGVMIYPDEFIPAAQENGEIGAPASSWTTRSCAGAR